MTAWPFDPIPMFSADLVVADPAWTFLLRSEKGEGKSAQAQYDCMSLAEIEALPVGHLVGADSWLFLWVTAPMLPEGLAVMRAWGFTYRSRISWRKVTPLGKPRMGPGYIARTLHEDILIGAIGHPEYGKALPSIFDGVAREHSRKPEEFYHLLERFAPQARRVELFARQSRPGWIGWGNERCKFDAGAVLAPAPVAVPAMPLFEGAS